MIRSVFSNFLSPYTDAGIMPDVEQKPSRIYEQLAIAYNNESAGVINTTRLFVPYYEGQDPDEFDDDLYYKLRSNEQLYDLIKWFNSKFIPEYPNMRLTTIRVRVKIFKSKLQKLIDEGIVENEVAVKLYLNLVDTLQNEERAMFMEQAEGLPF